MNFKQNTEISEPPSFGIGKIFLSVTLIGAVFLTPASSQASFWSSTLNIFASRDAFATSEPIIETSSQNMDLLEPATNFTLTQDTSTGIVIDGGEALLADASPLDGSVKSVEGSNQISTYIVRSGDTLAEIAEMYDVSVNTIMWSNDMTKSSVLKVGQTLVILPISGIMHTVVSGDTLNTIAKKYRGDVDEIASYNDLRSTDKISVGDTILIPDGQASAVVKSSSTGSRATKTSSTPSYEGYYMKPFIGGHKTQGIHGNNGVDYGMPVGTPLYAAASGSVLISKGSGYNGGYGDYVVIKHSNGTQTVYAHMSSVSVSVGQSVKKGQLIGYSGNTGRSTGPHLHFEIRGAKNPF